MDLLGMPVVNAMLEKFPKCDVTPKLAVIRVGENPDDLAYERGIIKRFDTFGAEVDVNVLPLDCTQATLNNLMLKLNDDDTVHGILMFRPLPNHLFEDSLKQIISPEKDVDCFGIQNNAAVYYGDPNGYPPCTPQAVIELLDHYGIEISGKKVTIVGRSMVVGKPLAMLLIHRNATVTVCHTRTADLESECRSADILIACAGKAKMITENHVRDGQIVIDVGINMLDDKLCGDVDYEKVKDIAAMITPVPRGVGTVTTSVLLKHTIESAVRR